MTASDREALAQRTLEIATGDAAVEAIVSSEDACLTRFTQNAIHQSVASANTSVRVRMLRDGRTGVAATNSLGDASLRSVVTRARDIAAYAPSDDAVPPLVRNAAPSEQTGAYDAATARATPELRAALVADIVRTAERAGLWAAGFVRSSRAEVTVANSSGTLVSYARTECALNVKQNAADSSGFAEVYANDIAALDGVRAGEIAARKALGSAAPIAVDPGVWTVILEPPAFGELLSYLSDHFSAQAYDEGSSFMSGRLGESCTGANVTLVDDFAHPLQRGMPFDYEGYPRKVAPLVTSGIASGFVTDAHWAKRMNVPNTGHALPAPSATGPQARNLVLSGGDKSVEQLIAETKRGLLISRFWYIRPVDHRQTIVTGMTRDGTFLIENGALGRGVRNMRFNQNILEALRRAEFAEHQVRTAGFAYTLTVPAVKLERFAFTSLTDF